MISIRLALFAEMVKGKPWTPATLKRVGGTAGVGVTFLEETFSSTSLRSHQKAAVAVLKSLLPQSGTGHQGTHAVARGTDGGIGLRRSPREVQRTYSNPR